MLKIDALKELAEKNQTTYHKAINELNLSTKSYKVIKNKLK
jgi:hypothetical protein